MNRPTDNELRAWAASNRDLAERAIAADAFAREEMIRVASYINPIFESYSFTDDDDGEGDGAPIGESDDLYLSDETEKLASFYEECSLAHAAHGFTGKHGHSPALIADMARVDLERKLLHSFSHFTGLGGIISNWNESLALAIRIALLG